MEKESGRVLSVGELKILEKKQNSQEGGGNYPSPPIKPELRKLRKR